MSIEAVFEKEYIFLSYYPLKSLKRFLRKLIQEFKNVNAARSRLGKGQLQKFIALFFLSYFQNLRNQGVILNDLNYCKTITF